MIVLAYHAIADLSSDERLSEFAVPPGRFATQIDGLLERGWKFVGLEEIRVMLRRGRALPKSSVLLTFDDGYRDLLTEAFPILAARDLPAVVFAITDRIGGTNEWGEAGRARPQPLLDEEGLRRLAAAGIAVGSHGATHRRLTELDAGDLDAEIEGSAERLQSIGLPKPVAFSYPYGAWNPEVAAAVRSAGYELAFTVSPGVAERARSAYALPRLEVFAADRASILHLKARTAAWPSWLRAPVLRAIGTSS
jgi:peptidoglycan/xylan/chitin deacetylase (PgdA/CDA1 family)